MTLAWIRQIDGKMYDVELVNCRYFWYQYNQKSPNLQKPIIQNRIQMKTCYADYKCKLLGRNTWYVAFYPIITVAEVSKVRC